jgi:hypothetical protein
LIIYYYYYIFLPGVVDEAKPRTLGGEGEVKGMLDTAEPAQKNRRHSPAEAGDIMRIRQLPVGV